MIGESNDEKTFLFSDRQIRRSAYFNDVLELRAHQITDDDTAFKLEPSEKTYAQELLDVPIPLENRIAHLIPYVEPRKGIFSATAIAEMIGFEAGFGSKNGARWVNKTAISIGLPARSTQVDSDMREVTYDPPALELIEEEWQWHKRFSLLEENLSTDTIAKIIARDPWWVRKTANELEIYETLNKSRAGRVVPTYPKILVQNLRHIILSIIPSKDTYYVNELAIHFGQEWEWVKTRLDKSGLVPRKEMTVDNVVLFHYPNESFKIIEQAVQEKAPPGGDWMTVSTMARKLAKSVRWVQDRVKKYKEVAEMRLDDKGEENLHYPTYVFEALEKEVEKINTYPLVDDTVASAKALAKILGHSEFWVNARLPLIQVEPETRRTKVSTIHTYYKKALAVEALKSIPKDKLIESGIILKTYSAEEAIEAFNRIISVDTRITYRLINKLRASHEDVPSYPAVIKLFGTLDSLNERRGKIDD